LYCSGNEVVDKKLRTAILNGCKLGKKMPSGF